MPDFFQGIRSLMRQPNTIDLDVQKDKEGIVVEQEKLTLETSDKDLLSMSDKWVKNYTDYEGKIRKRQKENELYYLGQQYNSVNNQLKGISESRPIPDNKIFEMIETLVPIYTRQNPDPLVIGSDPEVVSAVSEFLRYLSDTLAVRMKVKQGLRFWLIKLLGPFKISWDAEMNEIDIQPIATNKLILDKDSWVDENGVYNGLYIGERRIATADKLVDMFPKKKKEIMEIAKGKKSSKVQFTEWWTNEILFFTVEEIVLGKFRNPHWNYTEQEKTVNEYGDQIEREIRGVNHFQQPQMPYVFLSVFTLDNQPHDHTSLIEQNMGNQDLLSKRLTQIDMNVDSMNNGALFSGKYFSKEQAQIADRALSEGRGIYVPNAPDVRTAFTRDIIPSLPQDVYFQLNDIRKEMLSITGVFGSTPQGLQQDKTVRGKVISRQLDDSRSAEITDHVEQVYDRIYNWFVQMMYVYYDDEHTIATVGPTKAQAITGLSKEKLANVKLNVSIREGSLIPKSELQKRNEAVELWAAGAIDPISLYTRLDDADPVDQARKLIMFQSNPGAYIQEASTGGLQQEGGQIPPVPGQQIPTQQNRGGISAAQGISGVQPSPVDTTLPSIS